MVTIQQDNRRPIILTDAQYVIVQDAMRLLVTTLSDEYHEKMELAKARKLSDGVEVWEKLS
jgi:hypothetical protein